MKNMKELFLSAVLPISVITICTCLFAACTQTGEEYKVKDDALATVSSALDANITDSTDSQNTASASDGQVKSDSKQSETIYVYICGAVENPGVYELSTGSRVYQLIEAAGGLLSDADTRVLNQAETLTDGMQVTVYTQEETKDMPAAAVSSVSDPDTAGGPGTKDTKVNLNTAGMDALMTLSGIGEARAKSIIDYREKHGGFDRIEDIMQIEGIKEKLFEKIKDQIDV
ncbi:helix-hairpin-helix domain-containing protein [Blautia liquoris]|uniref:Helix-hairpin-helix domain-containing protein n=1 Tax=Blautia liquoris TaxID=2779518 RepID=A0A7M2RDF3_9FIRM|nr:helix-hairpin-helix domain-containing protein [Blautia liquoris]QOV18349.1 helix-hairpin-helix domain-containing protein [Blautia liquoris]